jgi:hypothetical protein
VLQTRDHRLDTFPVDDGSHVEVLRVELGVSEDSMGLWVVVAISRCIDTYARGIVFDIIGIDGFVVLGET